MTTTDERPETVAASSRKLVGLMGLVILVVALLIMAGAWLLLRSDGMTGVNGGDETVVVYESAQQMAELAGCGGSFEQVANAGNSLSAGQCYTSEDVLVEFRIYDSPLETSGWLEGTQQHSEPGIATFGGSWVVLARTRDVALASRIFAQLG